MKNRSVFIIKPDAYKSTDRIIFDLEKRYDVTIVKEFECTPDITAKLYPSDVLQQYFRGICDYMLESPCILGQVRGKNALNDLFQYAGIKSHPRVCEPGTIRNTYGVGEERTKCGIIIVKNAIHRPKSIFELLHDELIFALGPKI